MKTKKKYLKKLTILNRNIHINKYTNYITYNYLNNYNLKYHFLYLAKKKYYFKKKYSILNFKENNLKLNLLFNNRFSFVKSNFYLNNSKNKFFNLIDKKIKHYYLNRKIEITPLNLKENNIFFSNSTFYLDLKNNINVVNLYLQYKELIVLIFLLNMLKIFEIYKSIINLVYLSITINKNIK